MTDFAKWDRFVAELDDSDDGVEEPSAAPPSEEQVAEDLAGQGMPLTRHGTISGSSLRPGNARGNALSTNARVAREHDITELEWNQSALEVRVRVPLRPLGGVVREHVAVKFREDAFELRVRNAKGHCYLLRREGLPAGGVVPGSCACEVASGGDRVDSCEEAVVTLAKAAAGAEWPSLGRAVATEAPRPVRTLAEYSWSDAARSVRVWVSLPGVHKLPEGSVTARFRELSLDVTVADEAAGCDWQFAVTELPMEVVVDECYTEVQEDKVKIYLRKFVRTGWFKLQLQR